MKARPYVVWRDTQPGGGSHGGRHGNQYGKPPPRGLPTGDPGQDIADRWRKAFCKRVRNGTVMRRAAAKLMFLDPGERVIAPSGAANAGAQRPHRRVGTFAQMLAIGVHIRQATPPFRDSGFRDASLRGGVP